MRCWKRANPSIQRIKELIGELREHCASGETIDEAFDDKFMALMQLVMHHVADEETRLLPAAERLMPDELARLGAEMMRRRVQLMKPYAGEMAASAARSFPVGTATGAALLTASAVAIGAMWLSRGRNGHHTGAPPRGDRGSSHLM